MDSRAAEALNHWFAVNAVRADLGRTIALAPLVLIAGLVVAAWMRPPSNEPDRRAALAIGILAALGALLAPIFFKTGPPVSTGAGDYILPTPGAADPS